MSWQGNLMYMYKRYRIITEMLTHPAHIDFCSLDSLQKDYKKQMLMAAHALAVDAKNLLDVIDQSRLKMITQTRPH